MSEEKETLHGLNCPNCGGMITIPEGQVMVACPYCEMRSFVHGERGLRRYQAPLRVERQQAIGAVGQFLKSNWAIASNVTKMARITEAFVVHLPFWTSWARVGAWVFGQKQVGSSKNRRYEAREVRLVQDMTWNGAACDVGEFGVTQVPSVEKDLQPFNPDELHNTGMVFEPVTSFSDARQAAEDEFVRQINSKANLDRVGQTFIRPVRSRYALVYHPLWVMRYLYRGRAFQVVVDGCSGKVLYGKAPGNTLYRAGILVGGMAVGAALAIDVPAGILTALGDSSDSDGIFMFALASFLVGLGAMAASYRAFRYGEEYEYSSAPKGKKITSANPLDMITQVKDIEQWLSPSN